MRSEFDQVICDGKRVGPIPLIFIESCVGWARYFIGPLHFYELDEAVDFVFWSSLLDDDGFLDCSALLQAVSQLSARYGTPCWFSRQTCRVYGPLLSAL